MQPQRATRGIAAVALSSAAFGILLLALAVVLTACGSSAASHPTASPSGSTSSATTTASPTAGASSTPSTSATASTPGSAPASPTGDPGTSIVPSVAVTTAAPVPLTSPAPTLGGGRITIGAITSIQGTAQLPGEIAGPAVRVPVTITNGTTKALDLNLVVVDLVDAQGVSAGQLSAAPSQPFAGTLAPRASASAVYVFTLATNDRSNVRIVLTYDTSAPVLVFTGSIA